MDKIIYLASPYSHSDPAVRQARYEKACQIVAFLIQKGYLVFSPIVHSHPCTHYGLPTDHTFWDRYDRAFLERCDELWILAIDGWQISKGIHAEIQMAKEFSKPIAFLNIEGDKLILVRGSESCEI